MQTPATAGILSTAGDIVFSGTSQGDIFALHATTGQLLWKFKAGSTVLAAPVTYLVGGKQYIALGAGRAMFVFSIPEP